MNTTTTPTTGAKAPSTNAPVCPACGKPMVIRTAKKGKNIGNQFWGCTGFPDCTRTLKLGSEE